MITALPERFRVQIRLAGNGVLCSEPIIPRLRERLDGSQYDDDRR